MGKLIRGQVPTWTRSGSGSGYGDGWRERYIAARASWPKDTQDRLSAAEEVASVIAFWRSDANGLPTNGGGRDIEPAREGRTVVAEGPLQLCSRGTLHATMNPDMWQGERVWVVALYGEYVTDGEKFGALKREIIGEIKVAA